MKSSYTENGTPCELCHERTLMKRLKFILANMDTEGDKRILDVGCGLGVYTDYLSPYSEKYIGIDANSDYVSEARNRNINDNVEFHQMHAENLSFESNSFDVVIMIEVLEHVNDDDKTIMEIKRVLKPGGKFIVTAPNKLFPFETHGYRIGSKIHGSGGFGIPLMPWLPEFIRRPVANAKVYTPNQFKRLLTTKVFKICNTEFLGPNFDVLGNQFSKLKQINAKFIYFLDKIEKCRILNNLLSTTILIAEK